ncbi:carotenoid ester lipase precursor [Lactarius quietus]|nr:carotenoid ester lipase precursor [Lactarius quietus]
MAFLRVSLFAFCAAAATVWASSTSPSVILDQGTFTGTTANGTNKFLGIPYAQPPVGDLRFRLPVAPPPYVGQYNATTFGLSCPQQEPHLNLSAPILSGLPNVTLEYLEDIGTPATLPTGEDCLTVDVITPADATPCSELPVVVWFFGGAFEYGSPETTDGTVIVSRSIELGKPLIYVSLNYRVSAMGFLASQEVKNAGVANIGLWDQRMALRWVQNYIYAFGGDPDQVTIWGQSAGAISVSLQMLVNGGDTDGLFHAAFMQSGSPPPVSDIVTNGQPHYDFLVQGTNCSDTPDTLECLREVSFEVLMDAINEISTVFSYSSLSLAFQPYADGVLLADNPQKLVRGGKVANIPIVLGEVDDEGTLFSFSQTNVTSDADLRAYLTQYFMINVTSVELDKVLELYPQDPSLGSPYNTSTQNALTPEFKRIAAILGDLVFQSSRRSLANVVSGKQNTWSYLSKRLKLLPYLGSAHGSDVPIIYGGEDLTNYLIFFVTNLNPNDGSLPYWPQYTTSSRQVLTLYDSPLPTNITLDTYRAEPIEYLQYLSLIHPV